jgi:DNA-binding CsgD family transcriptional regulator
VNNLFFAKAGVQFNGTPSELTRDQPNSFVFVSENRLLGASTFLASAQELGMEFHQVSIKTLAGMSLESGLFSPTSVFVFDVSQANVDRILAILDRMPSNAVKIALVESRSSVLNGVLIGRGFGAVIDNFTVPAAIPHIVSLVRIGELGSVAPSPVFDRHDDDMRAADGLESDLWHEKINKAFISAYLSAPTKVEARVLGELVAGHSNKAIAENMGRALPTVKMHIHRMCKRYHLRTRIQLVLLVKRLLEPWNAGNVPKLEGLS